MNDAGTIYPNCPMRLREISLGQYSKEELYQLLDQESVHLNAYGETLFDDERFQVADTPKVVETVELIVAHLDFPKGATLSEIFTQIQMLGLELCPSGWCE